MTMCPNSKAACECQPQDGVMCPHGLTPDDWPRGKLPTVMPGWLQSFRAAQALAERFHETYERLAPSFGYETRPETRAFDAQSPNGRLMVAVCQELLGCWFCSGTGTAFLTGPGGGYATCPDCNGTGKAPASY